MLKSNKIKSSKLQWFSAINARTVYLILGLNFIFRLLILLLTNLGNDEVYYVQYAINPNVSHFDHPPIIGFLIRLSTFNLHFIYSDFFVRLGPLLIGTLNLFIVYKIGEVIKNKELGLIAALICSSSIYSSIIVGSFILPDTALSLFWLLAILFFIKSILDKSRTNYWLLLFGIAVGFGMASKYQAIFLWIGACLYFVFHDRTIFLKRGFWLSAISSILIFTPIFYWSLNSPYSGVNFHADRIGNENWLPSFDYVFSEILGQIFYNNPFNFILIVIAIWSLIKIKRKEKNRVIQFLFFISIPLILVTILMSLYNRTLPHWSGPSYFSLIIIAAFFYVSKDLNKKLALSTNLIKLGFIFFGITVLAGLTQIKSGIIQLTENIEQERVGENDFTIDLGAWVKISNHLKNAIELDKKTQNTEKSTYIITHNWFPGAHIDYYYALPNNAKLFVYGDYTKQHEYLRINELRGSIPKNSNAYFVTTSNYYCQPEINLTSQFETSELLKIIPIKIRKRTVVNLFIWKLSEAKDCVILNSDNSL